MKTLLTSALVSLFVVVPSSWAITATQTIDDTEAQRQAAIVHIIDLSGLTGLSYQARNIAQKALNESSVSMAKQYEVVDAVSSNWSPAILNQRLTELLEHYDDQQLELLSQALSNTKLNQARAKERQAITEQSSGAYQDYVQFLRDNTLAQGRMDAIHQLDQAMQFSALLIQARASVYADIQKSLKDWQPAPNWQQELNQRAIEFLLYVYRSSSNADILRLAGLYQEQELQNLLQQFSQILAVK